MLILIPIMVITRLYIAKNLIKDECQVGYVKPN